MKNWLMNLLQRNPKEDRDYVIRALGEGPFFVIILRGPFQGVSYLYENVSFDKDLEPVFGLEIIASVSHGREALISSPKFKEFTERILKNVLHNAIINNMADFVPVDDDEKTRTINT